MKVKLSNPQLNKLKSGINNGTEVMLNLSSNAIGYSNDKTNFPYKLLLTNTQVSRLFKAFANLSANIKLPKNQLSRMVGLGGFLGRLLGPLLKTGLSLMKIVLKPLAKSALVLLTLTAAASATNATIQK